MQPKSIRFDLVCDPIDTWTVWDNLVDLPASFEGEVLCGLTEKKARELAQMLNGMSSSPLKSKRADFFILAG
jgi:hypothetical protein